MPLATDLGTTWLPPVLIARACEVLQSFGMLPLARNVMSVKGVRHCKLPVFRGCDSQRLHSLVSDAFEIPDLHCSLSGTVSFERSYEKMFSKRVAPTR